MRDVRPALGGGWLAWYGGRTSATRDCFLPRLLSSLRGDACSSAAQHELLDLAGCRLWKLSQQRQAFRNLESREAVARERIHLLHADRHAGFAHDEGMRSFAPLLVRQTDDRDLHDGR